MLQDPKLQACLIPFGDCYFFHWMQDVRIGVVKKSMVGQR